MSEELNLKELFANYIKFNNRNKKFIFLIIFIGVALLSISKFKNYI